MIVFAAVYRRAYRRRVVHPGQQDAGAGEALPLRVRHGEQGPARTRMTIRYYIVAMLFLVFDLEILFLYPWAVTTKRLGLFGFA